MYVEIDLPITDDLFILDNAIVKAFDYDLNGEEGRGIKIITADAVVTIYPVDELARHILEVTKDANAKAASSGNS